MKKDDTSMMVTEKEKKIIDIISKTGFGELKIIIQDNKCCLKDNFIIDIELQLVYSLSESNALQKQSYTKLNLRLFSYLIIRQFNSKFLTMKVNGGMNPIVSSWFFIFPDFRIPVSLAGPED